jgi:hypothetical protein
MARTIPSLFLGLALAGLLGAGAASAQSSANTNAAETENPHSTDNAKRPDTLAVPRADADKQTQAAEEGNVHSSDNKDRAANPGAGPSATGDAEADNPHSVKNKDRDHHKRNHMKDGDAKPMEAPAAPTPDNK